jgi:hypothetical protein
VFARFFVGVWLIRLIDKVVAWYTDMIGVFDGKVKHIYRVGNADITPVALDGRPDANAIGKIKHSNPLVARCRYEVQGSYLGRLCKRVGGWLREKSENLEDCVAGFRLRRPEGFFKTVSRRVADSLDPGHQEFEVSLELLNQILIPTNTMPLLSAEQAFERINRTAASNQSVNFDGYKTIDGSHVVNNTCLVAMANYYDHRHKVQKHPFPKTSVSKPADGFAVVTDTVKLALQGSEQLRKVHASVVQWRPILQSVIPSW